MRGARLTGNRRFASLCGDGSLLATNFDGEDKLVNQQRSPVFFEPEKVFGLRSASDYPERELLCHLSRSSTSVDMSTDTPTPGTTWSLTTDQERAAGGGPGGGQPVWGRAADGLIYILMHQGGGWTHQRASFEIWVFNARDGKRTERLSLPEAASAVFVTPDSTR